MAVSQDEVMHVARLARLRLSDADIDRFTHQLNDILSHVEALTEAESGVHPPRPSQPTPATGASPGQSAEAAAAATAGAAHESAPLRADEPRADALDRPPEAIAAAWADGFFILPRLPALETDATEAQAADAAP